MWEMEQTSKKPHKNTDPMLNHATGKKKGNASGKNMMWQLQFY
jgi:hypothetical protein